jgi:LytS/YehU family sensor histidine kinase
MRFLQGSRVMGNNFTSINGGIIMRWVLIQLFLVGLVALFKPALWLVILMMLLANALATYLVVEYIQKHRVIKIKLDEHPIDPTLQIANETLPYLRRGLNEETAYKTAEIILKLTRCRRWPSLTVKRCWPISGSVPITTKPVAQLLLMPQNRLWKQEN